MTDYQEVANIFNAFCRMYTGNTPMGIEQFYKYKTKPLVRALMGNMNATVKVDVRQALIDMYAIFKEYRGMELGDADWEDIIEEYSRLDEKYKENRWCEEVILVLLQMIEKDSLELGGRVGKPSEQTEAETKAA